MNNSWILPGLVATLLGGAAGNTETWAVEGVVSPRQELSLNGTWEYVLVNELTVPPANARWRPMTVPGYLHGTVSRRAWLRRSFDLPRPTQPERLTLRFGGVKFNSRVLVNGRQVGGCFGGYDPFEVDITQAIRPGQANELMVGLHDWTGIFTPGKVNFKESDDWLTVRSAPLDRILAPIGGLFALYGIWDDVTLITHPEVSIKDLFIKPSVRRVELTVDCTLANQSATDVDVNLQAAVEDRGREVLRLPVAKVKVPAGKTARATLNQAWKTPHLWSHVDPYLYQLRVELSTGDCLRTRFGFREFWTHGSDFYLNGVKTALLATSWWPPYSPAPRAQIAEHWQAIKKAGCVAFRTHTQPWPEIYYQLADELGLLMIPEGAVWNDRDVYRINDPVFWENYARHLQAMVGRLKNHPSIVMWSLENEFYGGRLNDQAPAKADLVRLGQRVKEQDPTRPIFYESDGDPGGVADVIGIHYPHEYPEFTCWPNEAYWLDRPQTLPVGLFLNGEKTFWWRRQKPLYIGEFLWIPSSEPSWNTVFFGDEAYLDYRRYQNRAKEEAWKMQILGYRHQGVKGISPWTVIEGGPLDQSNPLYRAHCYAYQNLAAYCHDYDCRFYSGTRVPRRVEVYNDIPEPSRLEHLRPASGAGLALVVSGSSAGLNHAPLLELRVGRGLAFVSQFKLIEKFRTEPAAGRILANLLISLVSSRPPPPNRTLVIGGSPGYLAYLRGLGLRLEEVSDAGRLDSSNCGLLICRGRLPFRGESAPALGRNLRHFVEMGGRLLFHRPEGEQVQRLLESLGLDLTLEPGATTLTRAEGSDPLLQALTREDLYWLERRVQGWTGQSAPRSPTMCDGLVGRTLDVKRATAYPLENWQLQGGLVQRQGQGVLFATNGSATGEIDFPADGIYTLCVVASGTPCAGFFPLARVAVDGQILGALQLRGPKVGIYTVWGSISRGRHKVSVAFINDDSIPGKEDRNLLVEKVLVARDQSPGVVALTNPAATVAVRLGKGMIVVDRVRWDSDPVNAGKAARYACSLIGELGGDLACRTGVTLRCENMTPQPGMPFFQKQGGLASLACNGYIAGPLQVATSGRYTMEIFAGGSPAQGEFPIIEVLLDGRKVTSVQTTAFDCRPYPVSVDLTQGKHELRLAFVNDLNVGGEDRNLFLEKVVFSRE